MIKLGQRLSEIGRAELRENAPGTPVAEIVVMGELLDGECASISELADRTGYAQSRVSTAVMTIVQNGWAERLSDPDDGRRTLVRIPPEKLAASREVSQHSQASVLDQILADVPLKRRAAIIAALEELAEAVDRQDGQR